MSDEHPQPPESEGPRPEKRPEQPGPMEPVSLDHPSAMAGQLGSQQGSPGFGQRPEPVEGERGYRAEAGEVAPDARGRIPDPGSRRAGLITLLILIPTLALVIFFQQRAVILSGAAAEQGSQEIVPSGRADTYGLLSRFTVKFDHALTELDPDEGAGAIEKAGYLDYLDDSTTSPHEMLRTAVVAAEIQDEQGALTRLEEAGAYIDENEDRLDPAYVQALRTDKALFERIYAGGEALDADERALLVEHHGWHGRLALTYGLDDDEPERAELLGGGLALLLGLLVIGSVVILTLLGGFVLLIVGVVLLASGKFRFRFRPPGVGGSVYLETFAVFVGLFMLTQVVSMLLPKSTPASVGYGMQWLVALSMFWPMVRGVPFARWKADMGLHAPRGVFREIGLGIVTYLACVPLYVFAAIVTLVLTVLREMITRSAGGEAPVVEAPVTNPIIDLIERSDGLSLVVLGSLVMVWAPLVEEAIMRGALYRHLRSRMVLVFAAVLSAVLFGALHQYDVLMLLPVITLGAVFAFLREWRDSIVGCITAHALHNSTIFLLIIWIVSAT